VRYEQSFIAAFVKSGKRDRYREIVSDPSLRHQFLHQLAHFTDFDPKYRVPIPSESCLSTGCEGRMMYAWQAQ